MKKGCLIVLVALVVLLCAAAISGLVAYRIANQRFGLSLAPEISHDEYATSETRIRLIIKPELLAPYLIDYIPDDVDLPTGGFEVQEVLHHILPREVALLGRADVVGRRMRLTLFINEKRGGPLIEQIVSDANPFEKIKQISWTSDRLELRGRGALVAEGYLPIPGEVEAELFEIWPTRSQQAPAAVQGNNQAELVVDNSNGDILALAAAVAVAAGESWDSVRKEQMADMAVSIIESIHVARLAANMTDKNTVDFDLKITADPKSGPGLQFLLAGLAMPWLTDKLRDDYDLTLKGDVKWDEAQSAVVGRYTLSGLEPLIRSIAASASASLNLRSAQAMSYQEL
ncbi:MAG TPA: hypothetical protein ENN29_10940 [Candidatus Hydrogenedentes bacterium]|nr:hypothetical protein [Candidatus Hydrogenedentota bacterium]